MKIINFIRSIFDTEYSCSYFINNIEDTYKKYKEQWPKENQHSLLAHTWISYMVAKGADINDQDIQEAALPTTELIACVDPTLTGRALGIFLLYRERPYVFERYKYLAEEFDSVIFPVLKARENGKFDELYKKYN